MSKSSSRFRYGGALFSAASALELDGGLGRPRRLLSLLAATVRRPRRVAALIVLLVGTRSEHVVLSDSLAGRAIQLYLNQRFLGVFPQNRLCRGVLLLPPSHADYLRGRPRQALRTNVRRAAAAGIRCQALTHPSCAMDAASKVLHGRRAPPSDEDLTRLAGPWPELFARPEMTLLVARDEPGRPLAVAAAVIDDEVCLIELAVARSHEARWALHDYLVRILIARGVRYLLAEGNGPFGALGFGADLHHYQHLLGYQLRHLVPRTAHSSSWRWGLPSLRAGTAPSKDCAPPVTRSTRA